MKNKNTLWNFLASVRLAIFILVLLSVTSIIGTVIPQHKPFAWYVDFYGSFSLIPPALAQKAALFTEVLDLADMYSSWWYRGFLALLAINLIVCTIDRFPTAWKQINEDISAIQPGKLAKMKYSSTLSTVSGNSDAIQEKIVSVLSSSGLKTSLSRTGGALVTGQSGNYSRLGVYIVHISVLVIFLGGLLGTIFGYKGSIMIPETSHTNEIFNSKNENKIDLGFDIRCDAFSIDYYESGMPKEYTTTLTILENDREILTRKIEVNSPLTYKGITFYQSTYEALQNFLITVQDKKSGKEKVFTLPYRQLAQWKSEKITFGITRVEVTDQRVNNIKLWFNGDDGKPVEKWIPPRTFHDFLYDGNAYSVTVKQKFATGLQITKDPGIWLVYLGCFLLLFGLYTAFFLSHKRIWVTTRKEKDKVLITIYGSTNKNHAGFKTYFTLLGKKLEKELDGEL